MLNIDTSRAPGRPAELQGLVVAIRDADAADESSWLEWKSTLDLHSGKSARVHIARAILGFANRMPEDAAHHMEGHGFLVIGAEPGAVHGVAPLDPVDLDQQVTAFIGSDGPRWHPSFLNVANKTVLVIDVDPPRQGDPIYVARKSSDGITDGSVLVRGKGGTRPATSAQMDALQRRLHAPSTQDDLRIALEVAKPAAVDCVDFDAEAWLRQEELRLLHALPDPSGLGPLPHLTTLATSIQVFQNVPEDRTEEQYRAEIAAYIDRCRDRFPRVLSIAASKALTPLTLRAQNLTAKNLPELVVEVHVSGAVEAINPDRVAIDSVDRLPRAPRKWGPRPHPTMDALTHGIQVPTPAFPSSYAPRPRPQIENGGSTKIDFPPVDLRPHRFADLESVVLLVQEPPGSALHAMWTATSSGTDGAAAGELLIAVSDRVWTVRDWDDED